MKLINLVPLKEQENTVAPEETKVKIDILGDEQEVTIKTTPGKGLDDVTISWNEPWGEEVHIVDFEAGDIIDDHGNEGKDMLFTAEASFGPKSSKSWKFSLEVYVEASYPNTDPVEWDWDTLEIDNHEDATAEYDVDSPEFDPKHIEDIDEAYGERTGGNAASNSGNYGGSYGASGEDQGHDLLHEDDEDILEIDEEDIEEGTCGYTQKVDGKKLKTPGDTNHTNTTADTRTNFMRDSRRNPLA